MEIVIEQNLDNNLFEEVAFYKGMLGEFSYDPRQFCITFATIKGKQTDVLRYTGEEQTIHLPDGLIAVPYLLKEGYDTYDSITIVNHSRNLIDIDYILYKAKVRNVVLEGFGNPVYIQTAESAFEGTDLEAIDIPSISLSKCKNMIRMFADTKLTQIDLSSVYLQTDANLQQIFANCTVLQDVKLFNNGAGETIELMLEEPFYNCSQLKDLQIYDADEFKVEPYEGDIRKIIPEVSPLYSKMNTFIMGFVPEFNEKLGVQLNDSFDIKFINEYSMMLRKTAPKEILNNITFIFRMCQELRIEEYGTTGKIGQIHFVKDITKESAKRSLEDADSNKILFVQPRRTGDEKVTVYALYYGTNIKGYRIKYNDKYYDVTPTEYVQLGLTGIVPSKKLKLTAENEEFVVRQRHGETVTIYGFDELVNELEQ